MHLSELTTVKLRSMGPRFKDAGFHGRNPIFNPAIHGTIPHLWTGIRGHNISYNREQIITLYKYIAVYVSVKSLK